MTLFRVLQEAATGFLNSRFNFFPNRNMTHVLISYRSFRGLFLSITLKRHSEKCQLVQARTFSLKDEDPDDFCPHQVFRLFYISSHKCNYHLTKAEMGG